MTSKNNTAFSVILFFICLRMVNSNKINYPAIFNFGDSNSDTGEAVAGLGYRPPWSTNYTNLKSYGRFCDGYLIVDFLVKAMQMPFLNPYLDSMGLPNFKKGCNFAAASATIHKPKEALVSPFDLKVQVDQFLRFKDRSLELLSKDKEFGKYFPDEDAFKNGLYMFDIGHNDIAFQLFQQKTVEKVLPLIPTVISIYTSAIKDLYEQGARHFWIHNTGPLGCYDLYVAIYGTDPSNVNEKRCVISLNKLVETFNRQLCTFCSELRVKFPDANVTCVDIFAVKSNLIANYSKFGFEEPTKSCFIKESNGSTHRCKDPSKHVSWDGIHFTEAANKYIASQILTGKYSNRPCLA